MMELAAPAGLCHVDQSGAQCLGQSPRIRRGGARAGEGDGAKLAPRRTDAQSELASLALRLEKKFCTCRGRKTAGPSGEIAGTCSREGGALEGMLAQEGGSSMLCTVHRNPDLWEELVRTAITTLHQDQARSAAFGQGDLLQWPLCHLESFRSWADIAAPGGQEGGTPMDPGALSESEEQEGPGLAEAPRALHAAHGRDVEDSPPQGLTQADASSSPEFVTPCSSPSSMSLFSSSSLSLYTSRSSGPPSPAKGPDAKCTASDEVPAGYELAASAQVGCIIGVPEPVVKPPAPLAHVEGSFLGFALQRGVAVLQEQVQEPECREAAADVKPARADDNDVCAVDKPELSDVKYQMEDLENCGTDEGTAPAAPAARDGQEASEQPGMGTESKQDQSPRQHSGHVEAPLHHGWVSDWGETSAEDSASNSAQHGALDPCEQGLFCAPMLAPTPDAGGLGLHVGEPDMVYGAPQACILVVKCGIMPGESKLAAEAEGVRRKKLASMQEALQEAVQQWNTQGALLPLSWTWGTALHLSTGHCDDATNLSLPPQRGWTSAEGVIGPYSLYSPSPVPLADGRDTSADAVGGQNAVGRELPAQSGKGASLTRAQRWILEQALMRPDAPLPKLKRADDEEQASGDGAMVPHVLIREQTKETKLLYGALTDSGIERPASYDMGLRSPSLLDFALRPGKRQWHLQHGSEKRTPLWNLLVLIRSQISVKAKGTAARPSHTCGTLPPFGAMFTSSAQRGVPRVLTSASDIITDSIAEVQGMPHVHPNSHSSRAPMRLTWRVATPLTRALTLPISTTSKAKTNDSQQIPSSHSLGNVSSASDASSQPSGHSGSPLQSLSSASDLLLSRLLRSTGSSNGDAAQQEAEEWDLADWDPLLVPALDLVQDMQRRAWRYLRVEDVPEDVVQVVKEARGVLRELQGGHGDGGEEGEEEDEEEEELGEPPATWGHDANMQSWWMPQTDAAYMGTCSGALQTSGEDLEGSETESGSGLTSPCASAKSSPLGGTGGPSTPVLIEPKLAMEGVENTTVAMLAGRVICSLGPDGDVLARPTGDPEFDSRLDGIIGILSEFHHSCMY